MLPYDKRLLASRLGMTPEHLSRAFASLRRHGVNTGHGRIVILNNPAALTAFARQDPIEEVAANLPTDDEQQHN
jgi:CRP/FNR family transcriptional activator FtrB